MESFWPNGNALTPRLTYTGMYSFIENFNPDQGYLQRSCNYGTSGIKPVAVAGPEVTNASFSFDATASAEQRMDYQGGVTGNNFYLKMVVSFLPTRLMVPL